MPPENCIDIAIQSAELLAPHMIEQDHRQNFFTIRVIWRRARTRRHLPIHQFKTHTDRIIPSSKNCRAVIFVVLMVDIYHLETSISRSGISCYFTAIGSPKISL